MGSLVEPIYGLLPEDWVLTSIGNLVEDGKANLQTGPFGTMLHASAYRTTGTPVVAVLHIGDNRLIHNDLPRVDEQTHQRLVKYELCTGDILFGRKGAVERRALVTEDEQGWLQGSDCIRLRFLDLSVDARYISYVLGSNPYRSWIVRNAQGATMPSLNQEILGRIPIPLPSPDEQRAIAFILGSLDNKIELNRRENETLEATAHALFKSWFVDFDPVRAKAEGRQPAGMDAATAALFPDSFDDSPLGDIPRGWGVEPLPEAIDVNPSRSLRHGVVAPYLEMSNMPTSSARAVAWEYREFGSGMRFRNGDVLVARITPCLENGKTAYIDFLNDGEVGWGSTEYIVFRPKWPLPPEYAYFLARQDDFRTFAIQNMTGTSGRQRVPADCFNSYLVVVPPELIAKCFGEWASNVMLKMKQNDEESRTLAATRDALLPRLLSGELRVRDVHREK